MTDLPERAEVVIVGGGLSGLALARGLAQAGRSFLLLEARERLGGRILSASVGGAGFDLGPAWFWRGQPRIAALLADLGLPSFAQHTAGDTVFQDETGQAHCWQGASAMQGSLRVDGGFGRVITSIAADLPADALRTGIAVTDLSRGPDGVRVTTATGQAVTADQVVLALPPRLAATLRFDPPLPPAAIAAMAQVPTWMAGQAKALAVYETAFWRQDGLSGTAMSRRGPMVEVHDASPVTVGPAALFGFIGVPPAARRDEAALRAAVQAQLVSLFGLSARNPRALILQDWATEPRTATAQDAEPLRAHPAYGPHPSWDGLWDGHLRLAGTEVAAGFGGYLEGALEAAAGVLARL